ncbi:MAG: glycosyltransferase [Bacteroidaceae bacterium]
MEPYISFIILSYNQESFIKDAIIAAFSQDYSNMEILISDDYSTDHTLQIIQETLRTYKTSHKVIIHQNKQNVGLAENLNTSISLSNGDWFVVSAGDDISLSNRVSLIATQIKNNPQVYEIGTGYFEIHGQDITNKRYRGFRDKNCITGATAAWSRILVNKFGPIIKKQAFEDTVYPFRCLLLGQLILIDTPTVKYRLHQQNMSSPITHDAVQGITHLLKLRDNLIETNEQRLLDLEKATDLKLIDKEKYELLKSRIKGIIYLFQRQKVSETLTLKVLKTNDIIKKTKYLFNKNKVHPSFKKRLKTTLLSFKIIRIIKPMRLKKSKNKETPSNHIFRYMIDDLIDEKYPF